MMYITILILSVIVFISFRYEEQLIDFEYELAKILGILIERRRRKKCENKLRTSNAGADLHLVKNNPCVSARMPASHAG